MVFCDWLLSLREIDAEVDQIFFWAILQGIFYFLIWTSHTDLSDLQSQWWSHSIDMDQLWSRGEVLGGRPQVKCLPQTQSLDRGWRTWQPWLGPHGWDKGKSSPWKWGQTGRIEDIFFNSAIWGPFPMLSWMMSNGAHKILLWCTRKDTWLEVRRPRFLLWLCSLTLRKSLYIAQPHLLHL